MSRANDKPDGARGTIRAMHGLAGLMLLAAATAAQTTLPLRLLDGRGRPVPGLQQPWGMSDAEGRIAWQARQVDPKCPHLLLGPEGVLPWGAIPVDATLVNLRAEREEGAPIDIHLGPTSDLLLVGQHDGRDAELVSASLFFTLPFRSNLTWRSFRGGASGLVRGLPAGLPIRVRRKSGKEQQITLRAGAVGRIEIPVPAPAPSVRYRLVDDKGQVLTGADYAWGGVYNDKRGTLRVALSGKRAQVALRMLDGKQWTSKPFTLPRKGTGTEQDGGDLVLYGSKAEYCRGRIVDTEGKPVAMRIMLGNHVVFDTTESDAQGRFVLRAERSLPDGVRSTQTCSSS